MCGLHVFSTGFRNIILLTMAVGLIKAEINILGVIHSGDIHKSAQEKIETVVNDILDSDQHQPDGSRVKILWRRSRHQTAKPIYTHVCDLLENGVHGIVSVLPKREETYILHLTEELCLPHVTITDQSLRLKRNTEFTIWSSPTLRYQKLVIRDLIQHFGWETVGILHDNSIERTKLTDLIIALSELQVQVILINPNIFSTIAELLPALPTRMLFLGSVYWFQELKNKNNGTFGSNILWLVVTEDITQSEIIQIYTRYRGGIVFVKRKWREIYSCQNRLICNLHHHCIHLGLQEDELVKSLLLLHRTLVDANLTQDATNTWECSLCWHKYSQSFTNLWNNISVHVAETSDSMIYEIHSVASMRENGGSVLSSGWKPRAGTDSITKAGEWDAQEGLTLQQDTPFRKLWHDFGKKPILVATIESPPFIEKRIANGTTTYAGFAIDILNELALRMGFNYTMTEPPDGFYGALNKDGTWNGMVGMVYRGEVEMAIGTITITSQREQVVDFTDPISEGSSGIIMRSLGFAGGNSLFQTMKPFSTPVWLTICGLIVLVSLVSFIINYFTPYQPKHNKYPGEKDIKSFKGNCWMVYASITEQGVETHPRSTSGRCILGFWWVFTIVLVAAYTANLTAVLTVALPPSPINSLRQLLAQDTIQPIVQAGTSFETLFQNSKSELYKQTWSRLRGSPKIAEEDSILELVKAGGYAYIADRPILAYRAAVECLTFSVAEESFDVVGYGIVIPEGASYLDTMNRLIVKMQEAGLMDKWRRYWWSSNSSCQVKSQAPQSRLGLDSLGGLFLVYLGTAGLACICYVAEMACKRQRWK